jgi:hypothetical protein
MTTITGSFPAIACAGSEHHRRLGAPHLALRQDKVGVIGCERDATAVRLDRRNIRGLDQRLGRHADEGRGLSHGTGSASDQTHYSGVGAAVDDDCAGRPARAEQTSADQLGQLWRNGRVANVSAPPLIRTTGAGVVMPSASRTDVMSWSACRMIVGTLVGPVALFIPGPSVPRQSRHYLPIPRSRRKRPT